MKQHLHSYIATLMAMVLLIAVGGCCSTWKTNKPIVSPQAVPGISTPGSGGDFNIDQGTNQPLDLSKVAVKPSVITEGSSTGGNADTGTKTQVERPKDNSSTEGTTENPPPTESVPTNQPPTPIKALDPLPPTQGPGAESLDGRDKYTKTPPSNPDIVSVAVPEPPYHNISLGVDGISNSPPLSIISAEESPTHVAKPNADEAVQAEPPTAEVTPKTEETTQPEKTDSLQTEVIPDSEKTETISDSIVVETEITEATLPISPVPDGDIATTTDIVSPVSDSSIPTEPTILPPPSAVGEEKESAGQSELNPTEEKENIVTRREGKSYAVSPTMSMSKHEKITSPTTNPQEIPIHSIIPGGRPSGYSKSTYTSQPLRTIVVP